MDGITLTNLKKIHSELGSVMHAMKESDPGFSRFGEAYFSTVARGCIKGWKKHQRMTLNLIVPIGKVKFAIYDEGKNEFFDIVISQNNYKRLTVAPGLWVAFKGLDEKNILLNIADIEHAPGEFQSIEVGEISYVWEE